MSNSIALTRSDFGRLALAGLALAAAPEAQAATYNGVRIGIGTYSFRGLQLDEIIRIVSAADAGGIELESPYVEPTQQSGNPNGPPPREALRQWRLAVPLDRFSALRKRLARAGISSYAYSVPVDDSFTDDEIDRVLLMTKALGAPVFNTSATLTTARRLAPFAEKHKLAIGLHPGGSGPDRIGTGASYLKAFEFSPYLRANLDLYLFRDWGPDPLAFVKQIHSRVTTIHFHDRKFTPNPPVSVPFGEGDTPARELLLLAKREKYRFTFSIERIYTFPGLDQLTEIRRSLDYCRRVLS